MRTPKQGPPPAMSSKHVAIVAPPLPGHWDPLKILGKELVARGHRITFLHMPDAARMLTGTPFAFEGVGAARHGAGSLDLYMKRLAQAPSLVGFLPMVRATAAISGMLLEALPDALARIGADAVLADSTEAAGGMAARRLGLPYITSITGLPLLRDPAVPPPYLSWNYRNDAAGLKRNAGGYRVADLLMRPIQKVLDRYGDAWGLDGAEAERGSPLLQVAQCPPGLDFPRHDLPASLRYCGPFRSPVAAPVELPQDGRPLVYCSLGSLQGNRPGLFAAMAGACADVGARAVVATGGLLSEQAARALPGDPIVGSFWPQPAVLPLCSAAILHGGFNTVLDALGAGVPMLVAPLAFEQPGTAARVVHAGAGRALFRGRLTRKRLRDELGHLLSNPSYRQSAQRMGAGMASLGGATNAADLIDRAFRTGKTPAIA
jgi:zeaxanthin glucosyltransferase